MLLKPMYQVDALTHIGPIVGYACDCIQMMLSIYEGCSFFIFSPIGANVKDNVLGFGVFLMLVLEVLECGFSMFVNNCLAWSKVKSNHIEISLPLNSTRKQAV